MADASERSSDRKERTASQPYSTSLCILYCIMAALWLFASKPATKAFKCIALMKESLDRPSECLAMSTTTETRFDQVSAGNCPLGFIPQ